MGEDEHERNVREFKSYLNSQRQSVSDSVTAIGQAMLAVTMQKIETDKKIDKRKETIDKLLDDER